MIPPQIIFFWLFLCADVTSNVNTAGAAKEDGESSSKKEKEKKKKKKKKKNDTASLDAALAGLGMGFRV